ncbi:recombinase family protein [Ruminiclostridium cellobioparum]|uniref:recombinase family protein n=1 Tax=Ruminiclostridium cellobioparum TaxID=29355 RepID=UPI0028A6E1AC|nr:recombinase family protein [Ruminiclostridium cellobioparum]
MLGFNKPDINYHIGIYVRQSRDENEENLETIETQKKLLVDYVKRNNLGTIYKTYVDDNVSGSGFERNALEELKKDVLSCNINLIVLKDLSRLGRNNAKTLLFLDFLEEYGVRVITSDGRYDSLKDNETVGIDTWYNERYVRDISKKIRANLRFKIEQGEYIGNAPYGYVKSVNEKNKLVVDTRTAPVVREIFGLYKQGYGYAAIANMLNGRGYPSPSSKNSDIPITPWNQVAVQRILCNRVYIGDTVQGVSEKISFKNKKTRRLPFDKWIITTNTHEPIVKNEDFEEVQKIRAKKRSNQGYNRNISHLLSNMLYCGKCGKAMYVRVRKDRPVGYICSSYSKNGSECCSSHYVTEQTIIDVISDELLEMLSNREFIDSFSLKYCNEEDDRQKRYEMAQKLEQQIAAKQKQQDILYLDRLEAKISEQLFIRMNKNIEERISTLRKETEKLLEEEKKQLDKMHVVENFINRIKTQGINKNIIEQMVNRIIVYDSSDSAELRNTGMSMEEIKNGLIVIEYNYNNWREG